ncbi:MAG: TonB-dependent receptor, partial [Desulfobacterales bacterium]
PSSSLYGTSAFFAVINVITQRGKDLDNVEVSADAGSFDTYKGRFSYGHVFDNALEILISASLYDSAGQELYFKEFDDPETHNGFTSKAADKQEFQSAFFIGAYGPLNLQAGYVSRTKRLPTAAWETVFNGRTELLDEQTFVDLKYEASLGENSDLMARVSYSVYEYGGEYLFDYAEEEDDPSDLAVNVDVAEGQWWLGEVKLSTSAINRNKITLGTEWRLNTQQDQQNYDRGWEDDPWLDSRQDSSVWALYLQDEIRIHDGILLNAGIRYDNYDTFGGKANPRIALICQPFDETTIKVLYGKAFRAPNTFELYYNDGDEDATQKGNVDLRPEEITTYEVVVEQKLGEHFRGKVSLYHYKIDDLITEQIDPDDELIVYRNANETEANGIEVVLTAKLESGIEGRARYSFSDAKDGKTDIRLSNSPRHMGKVNISFPVMSRKLFGGVELQYMGERSTLAGEISDGSLIANATVSSHGLLGGLDMSISVYNLFDKSHGDPGSAENEQDIIEQDGRTFRVKLLYRF